MRDLVKWGIEEGKIPSTWDAGGAEKGYGKVRGDSGGTGGADETNATLLPAFLLHHLTQNYSSEMLLAASSSPVLVWFDGDTFGEWVFARGLVSGFKEGWAGKDSRSQCLCGMEY